MKLRIVTSVAAGVLAITMVGCLSPHADSQPPHTYRLSLEPDRAEARPSAGDGPILLVGAPQAEPGYETPKMVYLKRPHEIEHYAVNQWADQPARMFASLLVQSLGRTESWRAVVPLPTAVRGDFRLDSYGFAVQQEFMQNPSLVRVTVRAQLVDLKKSNVVSTRSFERVAPAPTEDAYGGVLAANRATAALLDDMAAWLKECVLRVRGRNR